MTHQQPPRHSSLGVRFTLAAALFTLGACGSDGPLDVATRTTPLCNGIVGMEAIAWEYYNGVPVVDPVIPPPFPDPIAGSYSHPNFPLLGFTYAQGWTPFTIQANQTVGVDLIRDGNTGVWRSVSITANGTPDARQVREGQTTALLQFVGVGGAQPQIVCLNEGTAQLGGGLVTNYSNALVRAGTQSAILIVSVTPFPGLPTSSVSVRLNSAPTAEYPARLLDSFMAVDWQMLSGELKNVDSDGDGWFDQFDQFPNDPTRN